MKYVHLKFSHQRAIKKIQLRINDISLNVSAKAGKWFTNIPTLNSKDISIHGDQDNCCELCFSDEKIFHADQLNFDVRYGIKKHDLCGVSVSYALSGELTTPRKILITFPGVSNFDNVNYRLSALTSLQTRLQDTLILAFQDKEGVYGNYLFEDSSGSLLKPTIVSLIEGLKEKFNLNASDIIFYGNSKGATIALDYLESYPKSYFFIDIPQLDLYNYNAQNDLMRYSIGYEARKHYNFVDYLPTIKNKLITYSFAENDFDNSRRIPMRDFKNINVAMLKDMEHSGSAMELVKRQFTKIIQLISSTSHIDRPQISANWIIKEDRIFFSRSLGSFKDESDISKLYVEIEFHNNESSLNVSLNYRFDKFVIVHWENGFDILSHLPDGRFQTSLHVYSNYKEYVYPLKESIIIDSGEIHIKTNSLAD
ncbi:hypothetical protein [Aeromonas salmonicida]|uniref:hypothetical protein n=1 Tax=Aeromonas salmonicida TaxID=645 RepID=UPI0038D4460D